MFVTQKSILKVLISFIMRFLLVLLVVMVFNGCNSRLPEPLCADSGQYIMTLNNAEGQVMYDSLSASYVILFNLDGGLEYNLTGYPCNLPQAYQALLNISFDAELFELKNPVDKHENSFSMSIKDISYR